MESLITAVGTVLNGFLDWFNAMSTAMIANPMIALMFGLGIALLIYRLIVGLVGKASFRRRGRRR